MGNRRESQHLPTLSSNQGLPLGRIQATNMRYTKHAAIRAKQRGIPKAAIDLLDKFGRRHYDHHGAVRLTLDRRARQLIAKQFGKTFAQLKLNRLYAVVSVGGDAIITVGHRTK